MILLRKFEVKWIKFGCTAAKSCLVVMYYHPMLHQCFAHTSLKNHSISFIFCKSILIDFRQIVIIFLILANCKKDAKTIIKFGCNIRWWITVPDSTSTNYFKLMCCFIVRVLSSIESTLSYSNSQAASGPFTISAIGGVLSAELDKYLRLSLFK
jgi:hypothetical protein